MSRFELGGDHDPKLAEILREVNEILKRNDVGGFVNLVSRTHFEWGISFPTWSGLTVETASDGGFGIRLNLQAEEVEKANLTAQFLMSNRNVSGLLFTTMEDLISEVEKMGAVVTTFTPSSPDKR